MERTKIPHLSATKAQAAIKPEQLRSTIRNPLTESNFGRQRLRRSKSFADMRTGMQQRYQLDVKKFGTTLKTIGSRIDENKPFASALQKQLPSTTTTLPKAISHGNLLSAPLSSTKLVLKGTRTRDAKNINSQQFLSSNKRPTATATTTVTKIAPKRTASASSNSNELPTKMSKPAKPAPYDYKARFNLLHEQHGKLKETHKETKEKLSKALDELSKYNDLQFKYTALQESHDVMKNENQNFITFHNTLIQQNTELKKNIEQVQRFKDQQAQTIHQLETDKSLASARIRVLEKERNNFEEQNTNLLERQNNLLQQVDDLKSDMMTAEELRRSLHNSLQDLKGNIRVFCRVRPPILDENSQHLCAINYLDESTIEIRKTHEHMNSITGRPRDVKTEFTFDKIFAPQCSQLEIFEELEQLVQSALDGYHVCVFAYGQTGSGKTFTMQGEESEKHRGIIPRAVNHIFKQISKLERHGWVYSVKANFLEIYNESIRDLLDRNNRKQHDIRQGEGGNIYVTNLHTESVNSAEELIQLMEIANNNRAVAATNFNEHSSRSHSVAKIILEGFYAENNAIYSGSLNLVDLAGSESAKTSDRMMETKAINKSLSGLGNVMLALYNKDSHVPYRNSKLTHLLQSCLGGNSKTLMVVNISPFEDCYSESVNSLRFATNVKEVKLGTKRNKTYLKLDSSSTNLSRA